MERTHVATNYLAAKLSAGDGLTQNQTPNMAYVTASSVMLQGVV